MNFLKPATTNSGSAFERVTQFVTQFVTPVYFVMNTNYTPDVNEECLIIFLSGKRKSIGKCYFQS